MEKVTSWVQSVTVRSCPPPVSMVEQMFVVMAEYSVEQLIVAGLSDEKPVPVGREAFAPVAG